jgi:DNA-binding transcriptional regulator LsrR (DeoR family)
MRYKRGLTNQEIAKKLGIGTKQVALLLTHSVTWILAQQRRLATIEAGEPTQERLEKSLQAKYPFLKKVRVLAGGKIQTQQEYAELIRRWAVEAANYFDRLVDSGDLRDEEQVLHVSLSGGQVNLEVMNALPDRPRHGVRFYASAFLARGVLSSFHIDPATNATIGWVKSGRFPGQCIYATLSPSDLDFLPTVSFEQRKRALVEDLDRFADSEPVETIAQKLDMTAVAFVGLAMVVRPKGSLTIGPTASNLLEEMGIKARELSMDGALADLAYTFFDENGSEPKTKNWRFFLTAGHYSDYKGVDFY